jgi:ComEC/Rec2-related protein
VVGRLSASSVERVGPGAAPWQAANRVRRLLGRGAEVLPPAQRALFGGFVLGDDRGQPPEVVDDFRGSGLSHVLVVSGQNVAFVLLLARPLTERLAWRGRWAVTMAVVGAFGVVTRFEPSVLRAAAMAAVAVSAGALGRPMAPLRTLALAVAGLVLVDPLLVASVGFQLSVGASLGIALWCRPIQAALPGPRALREAIAVTVAAQAGVAPILVPRFGGLPVAALVANPLAVPVAGFVTSWGLPAGVAAGLGGHRLGALVHLPTRLLIGWVALVARVAASVPLGEVGPVGLAVLALALAVRVEAVPRLGVMGWRTGGRALGVAAWLVIAAVLVAPGWRLRSPPLVERPSAGVAVHRAGGATVVVVGGSGGEEDLLAGLRRAGVRRIDLLVADGRRLRATADLVGHRWRVAAIRPSSPDRPIRLRIGGLLVALSPGRDPVVAAGRVRP